MNSPSFQFIYSLRGGVIIVLPSKFLSISCFKMLWVSLCWSITSFILEGLCGNLVLWIIIILMRIWDHSCRTQRVFRTMMLVAITYLADAFFVISEILILRLRKYRFLLTFGREMCFLRSAWIDGEEF